MDYGARRCQNKQNPEIADGFWCSPSITEMDYGGEYIKYYNNLLVFPLLMAL